MLKATGRTVPSEIAITAGGAESKMVRLMCSPQMASPVAENNTGREEPMMLPAEHLLCSQFHHPQANSELLRWLMCDRKTGLPVGRKFLHFYSISISAVKI